MSKAIVFNCECGESDVNSPLSDFSVKCSCGLSSETKVRLNSLAYGGFTNFRHLVAHWQLHLRVVQSKIIPVKTLQLTTEDTEDRLRTYRTFVANTSMCQNGSVYPKSI